MLKEDYIKFLEIFGIGYNSNGKLINSNTNEEFVQVVDSRFDRITYKCGDTSVNFIYFTPDAKEKKTMPSGVSVVENNIEHEAYSWEEEQRFGAKMQLHIKDNHKNVSTEITINPQYDEQFIKTTIQHKKDNYSGGCPVNVYCALDGYIDSDYRQHGSGGSWGQPITYGEELNKKNFSELLERILLDIYEFHYPELCASCVKCIPYLCVGYEKYIMWPVSFQDRYLNQFAIERAENNQSYINRVEEMSNVTNTKVENLKEKNGLSMETITKYLSAMAEFWEKNKELMQQRDKTEKKIGKKVEELKNFAGEIENKTK